MTVISVESLSKSYRLGAIGGGTLRADVSRWLAKLRGKEDPNSKIGEKQKTESRKQKLEDKAEGKIENRKQKKEIIDAEGHDKFQLSTFPISDLKEPLSKFPISTLPENKFQLSAFPISALPDPDLFWALRDVSFTVKQGEILGIIGRNGAGKSTLLKILSRVTAPTAGLVKVKGRIASLLEVGTGFHPELTGRENIFLNGAILGMTKAEIKRKFDEIVDFSGVEQFLDTPVKRYSSGMYVRLAFAVAAHLEPEILIIDEVLAVGDVQFQKKCLGKMRDISSKSGRTILFVSHNLEAIATLCSQCMVLKDGCLTYVGETPTAIKSYSGTQEAATQRWQGTEGNEKVTLSETWVATRSESGMMDTGAPLEVGLRFTVHCPIEGLIVGYTLYSGYGYELLYSLHDDALVGGSPTTIPREYIIRFVIPANTLAAGSYRIVFDVGIHMLSRIIESPIGDLEFELDNLTGIGRRYLIGNIRGYKSLLRPQWPIETEVLETLESTEIVMHQKEHLTGCSKLPKSS